jgi:glycosyltransferase involved in cell wall biosynthesis
MKILQVVPYFFPAWSYGGPAKLVYDTSLYFAQQGHETTIYTSDAYDEQLRMPSSLYVRKKNIRVHYFKNFHNSLTYTYNIFFTPGLYLRAIRDIKQFDVIHIHDFYTLQNFWIGILARVYNIPYVLSVHGCLEEERVKQRSLFKHFFYILYGGELLRHATKVIATSDNEVKAYQQHDIPTTKIIKLGHGINVKEFQTLKSKQDCKSYFKLSKKHTIVTFLGRIHKIKGLDILVKAIAQLKIDATTFVIAGSDDGYLTKLKSIIEKYKLSDKIRLLPACYGEEKSMLYKASDVFVYPSYSEGFSLGILEAAAAKLPLVISTGCHFPEVGKFNAGLIVPPNSKKFANAISSLIIDIPKRQRMSKNALKLINEKYSMLHIGDILLGEYAKIIN